MSVAIGYDRSESPPFPYVDINVSNPLEKHCVLGRGKIDTGASLTVVPIDLVGALNLRRVSEVVASGFDGSKLQYGVYVVDIKIGDILYKYIDVIAARRTGILVGRNLINQWRMRLDGKNCTGDLEPC